MYERHAWLRINNFAVTQTLVQDKTFCKVLPKLKQAFHFRNITRSYHELSNQTRHQTPFKHKLCRWARPEHHHPSLSLELLLSCSQRHSTTSWMEIFCLTFLSHTHILYPPLTIICHLINKIITHLLMNILILWLIGDTEISFFGTTADQATVLHPLPSKLRVIQRSNPTVSHLREKMSLI